MYVVEGLTLVKFEWYPSPVKSFIDDDGVAYIVPQYTISNVAFCPGFNLIELVVAELFILIWVKEMTEEKKLKMN